jgi:hypothetical protein
MEGIIIRQYVINRMNRMNTDMLNFILIHGYTFYLYYKTLDGRLCVGFSICPHVIFDKFSPGLCLVSPKGQLVPCIGVAHQNMVFTLCLQIWHLIEQSYFSTTFGTRQQLTEAHTNRLTCEGSCLYLRFWLVGSGGASGRSGSLNTNPVFHLLLKGKIKKFNRVIRYY